MRQGDCIAGQFVSQQFSDAFSKNQGMFKANTWTNVAISLKAEFKKGSAPKMTSTKEQLAKSKRQRKIKSNDLSFFSSASSFVMPKIPLLSLWDSKFECDPLNKVKIETIKLFGTRMIFYRQIRFSMGFLFGKTLFGL